MTGSRGLGLLLLHASALVAGAQEPPSWRIGPAPLLVIEEDGRSETEFLRIVGAFRLGDGRIVVANNGSSEVRIFRSTGDWERSLGRQGSGPGEFQFLLVALRAGDTLFTYDPMLKRVTSFGFAGEPRVLHTLTVNAMGGRDFEIVGRLADGRWVAQYTDQIGWGASPGVHRERGGIGIVGADGEGKVRWIAEAPSTASFVHNPTGNIQQARYGPIAFTPRLYAVASGGVLWFGESGKAEIVRFDVAANTRRTIRLPIAERTPDRALVAAQRAADAATDSRSLSFIEARFSAAFLPRHLPFFEGLLATPDGGAWLQEYAGLRSAPARYLVLDREGRIVARVSAPAGIRVTDVGQGHVVGVYRDADGVESVRVYSLRRD